MTITDPLTAIREERATARELLAQRDEARWLLREALALLPTACRYHGEQTANAIRDELCCETGRTAWAANHIREAAQQ